ncbi:MAG: SsrA-binding protein SmpB [Planctomycetota bacterium]|nr:SsrA-binding protein SmpB [Planctomycetota bacterium]
MSDRKSSQGGARAPTIENRQARFDFQIGETFEVGMVLTGSEVKSIRNGRISLGEGFVMARATPAILELHAVHIDEYPQASPQHQHEPRRVRRLLAHKKEIERLAQVVKAKGASLVPLKLYFLRGRAKLLIGVGIGRKKSDKRQAIRERDDKRDADRAVHRRK